MTSTGRTYTMMCVVLVALGRYDRVYAAIGDACTVDGDCNAGNNEACPSTACACATGYTDNAGTCNIDDCGSLSSPTDGTVSVTTTTYLSTATYSCNTGYTLTGSATVTCQAGGTWDAAPTCTIVDCGSLSSPTDGTVSVTTTTYLSTATYSCNAGYTLTGTATVTCQAGGTWDTAPTCTIVVDCGNAPTLTNGARTDGGGTTAGSTATYTCDTGFTASSTSITSTCQSSGSWTSLTETCSAPGRSDIIGRRTIVHMFTLLITAKIIL